MSNILTLELPREKKFNLKKKVSQKRFSIKTLHVDWTIAKYNGSNKN